MSDFRIVRQFGKGLNPTESRAYRVETSELLTEKEAMQLMRDLGSPYIGQKYDDQTKQEHQHELWQIQCDSDGGAYCAACGVRV